MPKTKLTTKQERLAYWKAEIRRGQEYQNTFGERKHWNRYYNYYLGNWKKGVYAVNKVYSMLRSMVPRIYFRNPKLIINASRPEFEPRAAVNQAVVNMLIRQLGIKKTCKKIIQDAFFCNRGIVKIGYDREFSALPHLGKKSLPADEKVEYSNLVREGFPWAMRTSPEDFLVPWGTVDFDDIRWQAHRVVRLLEDVKKDTIYENTADLKGGYERKLRGRNEQQAGISEQTITSQTEAIKVYAGKEAKWVEIWEIRDIKRGEVLAINLTHNKFLRSPIKDELQKGGVPFVDLCFNPDNDVYWGPSDVKILAPLQEELNEVRTQMSEHRRINLIKFLYDSDMLTPEQFKVLMDGQVGTALGIPGIRKEAVITLQVGEPVQLRIDAQEIERDVREVVGFARTEEGEYAGPPRRTKAEIDAVSGAHWIRVDERRDIMADFIIAVMQRVMRVVYDNWDQARVIPVVGPDNAVHWVQYTGKDLYGEYEWEVDMDTGRPVTTEVKRAEAEKLIGMYVGSGLVNEPELIKSHLKLFDWIDVDRVAAPPQQMGMGPAQNETMEQFAGLYGR